jgi:hypothetical protein
MASKKAVVGIVTSHSEADSVLEALDASGFSKGDISVLFPDKQGTRDFAIEKSTKAPEGAAAGAGVGGTVGGTLGLLAGIGALAIPGLGPFIAAGPIMAALSGVAAGAAIGSLTGALIGLGIPELEAKLYESKISGGHILFAVHAENDEAQERAKRVLENAGATDVSVTGEHSVPSRPEYETPAGTL